jgi:uncharacterized membrane protein
MPLVARACGYALGLACLCAASRVEADIRFCNEFPHLVYIAMAYPQEESAWISRGWLAAETGQCYAFDSALRVKTFYYRGESAPYRDKGKSIRTTWGVGMKFAILDNANFNYWNAQDKVLNSALAEFNRGVDIEEGVASVTVTFKADGKISFETVTP